MLKEDYNPPFNWKCPTCGRPTTITSTNVAAQSLPLWCAVTPEGNAVQIQCLLIECPNPDCREPNLQIDAHFGRQWSYSHGGRGVEADMSRPVGLGSVVYYPTSAAPLSPHVPVQVREDYTEAFLIRTFSPKAAATLARRALQGMIRDYWGINKRTLHEELLAIEDKCDPGLYEAMMGLKSIGNIGAHPERDISVIIDVDEDEPIALLNLLHLLDEEWYIAKAERKRRIAKVHEIAAQKRPNPGQ